MLKVQGLELPNAKKVNFEVQKNQSWILMGPNASGKSLLLKGLAYLYPAKFETFTFEGKDIRHLRPEIYRSEVLYLASFPSMNFGRTVEDFFQAPWTLGVYKNHVPQFDPAPYLELWKLKGAQLDHLSSGQRQLISFLRALTLKAKILLLDEPSSHLDQEKTLVLEKLLKEWTERTGGSFVLVSHADEQRKRLSAIAQSTTFDNLL